MKNNFVLADSVSYLLNRAGGRVGLIFARDIQLLGVTLPMWRVMIVLWENDGQRLGDIAERTSIDLSTLSRLLVTLQRKQYIVRRRSGKDGRALSVSLTDKGRTMTERIIPIAARYEAVGIRGIECGDLRRLKQMLIKFFVNIHTLEKESAAGQNHGTRKRPVRRGKYIASV
jgi:MarR family transcriptional regulator, organic hydroperoxide resistance regulator